MSVSGLRCFRTCEQFPWNYSSEGYIFYLRYKRTSDRTKLKDGVRRRDFFLGPTPMKSSIRICYKDHEGSLSHDSGGGSGKKAFSSDTQLLWDLESKHREKIPCEGQNKKGRFLGIEKELIGNLETKEKVKKQIKTQKKEQS